MKPPDRTFPQRRGVRVVDGPRDRPESDPVSKNKKLKNSESISQSTKSTYTPILAGCAVVIFLGGANALKPAAGVMLAATAANLLTIPLRRKPAEDSGEALQPQTPAAECRD